jgi:hypothetical protein
MHTNLNLLAYTRPLCCYTIPSPAPFSVLAPNESVEDVERVAVRLEVDELWRGVRRRCEPEAVVLSAVGRRGLDGHGPEKAVVERDGRDADGRRRVGRCDVNEFVAGGKNEVKEQQRQSAHGAQKREPSRQAGLERRRREGTHECIHRSS